MPVYNDVDFVEQSIQSVIDQSFTDFELIISDDCSTDGSSEICKKYSEIDRRIKYIRQNQNIGISRNMKFLLALSNAKYFMWAGDDDLLDSDYVKNLVNLLDKNQHAISAFSICTLIDEKNEIVSGNLDFNYASANKFQRIKYFVKNATDYFGYGIFVREKIKDVEFPVWWWPNKKTPYNNIYPTLCYYLTLGDFAYYNDKVLFYKRVKSDIQTNHISVGKNNALKESSAFLLRRFNLVCFSAKLIFKASSFNFFLKTFPFLFYYWFIIPSIKQLILALKSFIQNRSKF